MRFKVLGAVLGMALVSVSAEASTFLRINVDGTILTCDNTAALCGAGFTTAIGSNQITFAGTVNGVNFGSGGVPGVLLAGNSPGTSSLAQVLDTKFNISNTSGVTHNITVDFGQNNFTQPVGPGFLDASQTANWTTSTAGDNQTFQAWL